MKSLSASSAPTWIDVMVIDSQITQSHRNANGVVDIEPYALRLFFGVHHNPRVATELGGRGSRLFSGAAAWRRRSLDLHSHEAGSNVFADLEMLSALSVTAFGQ
jgi:hypothetical protein